MKNLVAERLITKYLNEVGMRKFYDVEFPYLEVKEINLLIKKYAKRSKLTKLRLELVKVIKPINYAAGYRTSTILVSDRLKLDSLVEQVDAILHEIGHWNQFVELGENNPTLSLKELRKMHTRQSQFRELLWDAPSEKKAIKFAKENVKGAFIFLGLPLSRSNLKWFEKITK